MPDGLNITVRVTYEQIAGLLVTACEDACAYWVFALGIETQDGSCVPVSRVFDNPDLLHNARITLSGDFHGSGVESRTIVLDEAAIRKGLEIMSQKYPKAWSDLLQENDDAETADIFLQCCAFGKLVFC